MVTEEQVLDSMRHIVDPDLGKDIVSLGFIKNLKIDGGDVSFTVELTTPACPVKEKFRTDCKAAVEALPGVNKANVTMDAMKPQKRPGNDINTLTRIDSVIAVSSCKGGVGKSTVAAQLARAIQREGLKVGLLDTDVYGPSLPTLFNLHRPQMYMKDNLLLPIEVDGLKLMSIGFVMGDAPAVLRGPMVSGYVQQLLRQTDWGDLDYLIIDMPPGTGDIQLTLVQQAAIDGAIIVTTPHSLSLVDVSRGILMFEKVDVPVLGIVENMSYFECDECGKRHYPFGQGAQGLRDRFGLKTLAEFPIIPGFSSLEKASAGADIEAVRIMAENLHREVGKRRIEKIDRPEISAEPGQLRIKWGDGSEQVIPNFDVRAACQCALCIEEFTGNQLLDVNSIPKDIQVEDIAPLGNYAVSIAWSDGHSSGIYSWDHLKRLGNTVPA